MENSNVKELLVAAELADFNISTMSKEDFYKIPHRSGWEEAFIFDCVVLLPTEDEHDSGYRNMDFVAVINERPICRLSGCSDVLHLDGVGGSKILCLPSMREIWKDSIRNECQPGTWSVDCLGKSGLFRLFSADSEVVVIGMALSSFEIFSRPRKKETKDE